MSADIALVHANVRTMNLNQPVAQAVAIKDTKIVKVGTDQEVNQLIGRDTKVINLDKKTVIPGLIDTHIHIADFGRCLLWLDLTNAKSIKELQNLLKKKAKQTPAKKWIIGRGWNQNRFKEKRLPDLSDLDKVAPDNPVILYHESEMICAVNSNAIALAGIKEQTVTLSGGTIDKNAHTGKLTGILRDSATNIVWQVVLQPTSDELSEATALACQKIAENGLTSVNWIVLLENELPIIQRLHAEGKLLVRVNVILPEALVKETGRFQSTDRLMLHVDGVFIAVDGYLDSKTAALSEPYSDDPESIGKMLLDKTKLAASIGQVLALGLQPVIHAMGDKAVDLALTIIEQNSQQPKGKPVRFRIEQAAVLNRAIIERLKKQNVVVSVQPKVIATEFSVWSATTRLGVKRAKWLHPIKTLLKEGVKVAGGSDCPMEPLNPFLGMQEAVLREHFPEQRLSVEEALRMYTIDAAYCSGGEKIKGSIEAGKLADLTVLSDDPLAINTNKIKDVKVELTIINGKIVYSNRQPYSKTY